jgi:pyruvate/2-oxoglutarate dehydrogenase complex dihydrolipoamide dehydrogenase (E3) component
MTAALFRSPNSLMRTSVSSYVQAAIRTIEPVDSPASLESEGVRVVSGDLSFAGPHSARVGNETIDFSQAVICTGSTPVVPPISGLAESAPLTSDSVWDLREMPQRLAILGGGNIGCELGQAFARLGSQVTIVEGAHRILPREDAAAAGLVARALCRDGAVIHTGSAVTAVKSAPGSGVLVLEDGTTVDFDRLLVSVGGRPRTRDLGLDRAGVEVDERGFIGVDSHLRTTNPSIWAAGDVTGHPQFTHLAGVSGSLAATNAILGLRRKIDTTTVPRVTFTQPEVAAVGVSSEGAATKSALRVVTWNHDHLDRAVAESDIDGFTKLVVDAKGRILGGTVVGPRAGETLGELTVAVRHGLRTRDLAATTHAYPTYNDGLWNAAIDDVRSRLEAPSTRRAVRVLSSARRHWVRSAVRPDLGTRTRSAG